MKTLIEFQSITKRFGEIYANQEVSFSIKAGSRHGVVGENGAGKSTIMKILGGLYQPDRGSIALEGKPVTISNPREALGLGIGMVHQHFMLVPTLTGLENLILCKTPALGPLKKDEVRAQIETLKKEYGFSVDLDVPVEQLSVGAQQQIEILKVLYQDAKILILDEPTAVLTPQEVDALFSRLDTLHQQGRTLILISHKLREILKYTDEVTVMRQGKVVATRTTSELTEPALAELMMGQERERLPSNRRAPQTEKVLEVRDLNTETLSNIGLEVHRSEIVGIAGIEGNGQNELIDCLLGLKAHTGEIRIKQKPWDSHSAYDWRQSGLSLIPPDRLREAAVLDFSLTENTVLGHQKEERFGSPFRINWTDARSYTKALLQEFDVRPPNPDAVFKTLSGGNQQKLVVARETSIPTQFLIAAHPTRGVDIGAIDFIHRHFLKLKDTGAGILLFSSELDEILAIADRVLVMYKGKIVAETKSQDAKVKQLGLWMMRAA